MLTIYACEKVTGADAIPYMRQEQREKLEGRFWTKTGARPNGCLEWTGATTGQGYGAINIDKVATPAHRVAFTLAKGPIPAGLLIRHRCNNPKCINPDHLEVGTHAENSQDAIEAGRLPTGPGSRPRKLTVEDAVGVIGAWVGGFTLKETGEIYGIALVSASHIRLGLTWAAAIVRHMDEALGTPETPAAAP